MKNTASIIKRFTKVKHGAARLNLAAVALLTALLGFSLAACDSETPAANTPPTPKAESVEIIVPSGLTEKDGEAYLVGEGGVVNFGSKVLPEGASKAVEWSVDDPSKAAITKDGGQLTLTAAATVGDTITVTAKAKGEDVKSKPLTIKVKAAEAPKTITIAATTSTTVTAGGTVQFSVTAVTDEFASRAVTWSAEPSTSGTFTEDGLLTVASDATPGTFTVKATSKVNTAVSSTTVTVTVVQPVKITVTGIDANYKSGEIELWTGSNRVASGSGNVTDGKLTATLHEASAETVSASEFTTPGSYKVTLTLSPAEGNSNNSQIDSKSIVRGDNPIPFTDFKEIKSLKITVTGLGSQVGKEAQLILMPQGAEIGGTPVGAAMVLGISASQVFDVGASPGTYDIYLMTRVNEDSDSDLFVAKGKTIAAATYEITFSTFIVVPPMIVTVTGVNSTLNGANAEMQLYTPGDLGKENARSIGAGARVTANKLEFPVYGAKQGSYDIEILIDGERYTVLNKDISKPLALSDFKHIPVKIRVTVTGMSAYNGCYLSLSITPDYSRHERDYSEVIGGKAVFRFYDFEPNASYTLNLSIYDDGDSLFSGGLNDKTLGADNEVKFSDFQAWGG